MDNNQQPIPKKSMDEEEKNAWLNADFVAKSSAVSPKEGFQEIQSLRKDLNNSGKFHDEAGVNELESRMRNLEMPGVYEKTKARELINQREEAIRERQNLDKNNQSWEKISEADQKEIADRIKWGARYQDYWRTAFMAAHSDEVSFKTSPGGPREKRARDNIKKLVGNEIELELSRNPQARLKARDISLINRLSEQIVGDKKFINLVNQEAAGDRNVRKIRTDIKRLLEEQQLNDN